MNENEMKNLVADAKCGLAKVISDKTYIIIKEQYVIAYKKGKLYLIYSDSGQEYCLGTLEKRLWCKILSNFTIFERAFRLGIRVGCVLDETNDLVSYHGGIYRINSLQKKIYKEHSYRTRMNNPLSFCRVKNIPGFPDCIIYGEYFGNSNREQVAAYARIEGKWEKVFSFPEKTINHIHRIVPDPYRNRLLVLTGDTDEYSGIWEVKGGFSSPLPILVGRQQYRSCVCFPMQNGLIYATDTPLERNYIYRWNLKKTDAPHVIYQMPGPCIYGVERNGIFLFSTSVEPDSHDRGLKYLFSYKLGEGVSDRFTHLIYGNEKNGFKEIIKLQKDFFPMALFKFGNIIFPNTEDKMDSCMFCPESVFGYNGKTLEFEKLEGK